jgi:putative aminopeptidase FrvX
MMRGMIRPPRSLEDTWRALPAFLLGALLVVPAGALAADHDEARGLLKRLEVIPAVAGYEAPLRGAIRAALPRWAAAQEDNLGNLSVTVGSGSPHLLLIAPMDEPGYVVTGITDGGYLTLQRLARVALPPLFDQFHLGQPLTIGGRRGPIAGVAVVYSTHLWRGDESPLRRGVMEGDLLVDVGARTPAEARAAGVALLDPVAIARRTVDLAGGRIAGPAAEDRAGCAALLHLLKTLDPARVRGTLTVAFTAQSAMNGRGAERLANRLAPEEVLVIDAPRPAPGAAPPRLAPGDGPAIGLRGAAGVSPELYDRVSEAARRSGVALQQAVYVDLGEGRPFAARARVVPLAIPVLYAATPAEVVDVDDVVALVRLLRSLVALAAGAAASAPAPSAPATPVSASEAPVPAPAVPANAAAPPAAAVAGPARGRPFALLQELVETPGVSGREDRVRDVIRRLLPAWTRPEIDAKGNLLVAAGPEQARTSLLFMAHMDETGYLVRRIRDDGNLEVRPAGGFFTTLYEGQVVLVHTPRADIGGVVPPRSDYFTGGSAPDAFGGEALLIDVGTSDAAATEALGVSVGDPVTVPKEFVRLAGSKGSGRAVDDRAGCAALLLALRRLDPARLRNRVTFAFTVEEEIGLLGAKALAATHHPALAVAVDTFVSSDTPLERPGFALGVLGRGPVIRAIDSSNITDRVIVDRVLGLARAAGLPLQVGLTRGGNDGSVFPPLGSANLAISWPTVHSHSPVEVIDERDLGRLGDLVRLIAERW